MKGEDFEILTVNIGEDKDTINEFVIKVKFDLPILLDKDGIAVNDWKVYAYPSNFILDRYGEIRYAYRGALEWDSDSIVKAIEDLL
jgi:predicted transcriptional regulator